MSNEQPDAIKKRRGDSATKLLEQAEGLEHQILSTLLSNSVFLTNSDAARITKQIVELVRADTRAVPAARCTCDHFEHRETGECITCGMFCGSVSNRVGQEDLKSWAAPAALPETARACAWCVDDATDGEIWETDCGHSFVFETDGPEANLMKFCCYCGKQLTEVRITRNDIDE